LQVRQTYSAEFKQQALEKVFNRGSRTINSVADELNMNGLTLKNWMRGATIAARSHKNSHAKRPEDWSHEERLLALHQSHGLAGEALNAWCRERGLFAHHLAQWSGDFCAVAKGGNRQENAQEVRELKQANVQLQRELNRKEKALAEAAALLVLQKKYRALFGGEG
jgi:transposase-like protein